MFGLFSLVDAAIHPWWAKRIFIFSDFLAAPGCTLVGMCVKSSAFAMQPLISSPCPEKLYVNPPMVDSSIGCLFATTPPRVDSSKGCP
jgi:hypothetical protein